MIMVSYNWTITYTMFKLCTNFRQNIVNILIFRHFGCIEVKPPPGDSWSWREWEIVWSRVGQWREAGAAGVGGLLLGVIPAIIHRLDWLDIQNSKIINISVHHLSHITREESLGIRPERPCLDRLAKQPIQFKYLDLRQTLKKTGDERRNHKRKLKSWIMLFLNNFRKKIQPSASASASASAQLPLVIFGGNSVKISFTLTHLLILVLEFSSLS